MEGVKGYLRNVDLVTVDATIQDWPGWPGWLDMSKKHDKLQCLGQKLRVHHGRGVSHKGNLKVI
jgi:hypothetical protein